MPDDTFPAVDDVQWTELFSPLNDDAAPVDPAALAHIRRQIQAAHLPGRPALHANHSVSSSPSLLLQPVSSTASNAPHSGTFPMKLVALLTTSAMVLLGLWWSDSSITEASRRPLGAVLDELEQSESFQFQVTQDGHATQVWVQNPGFIRWSESATRYRIARGARLWLVDEELDVIQESANSRPAASGPLDLLASLNMSVPQRHALRQAMPTGVEVLGNRRCWVYRRLLDNGDHPQQLEAFVDMETKQLAGLTLRDPQRAGGPPLVELTLIALNAPIDESKFRVPTNLADVDHIGKISDVQGLVTLQPVGARRWTSARSSVLIKKGDWVRTAVRGANAITVELSSHNTLTIGPGSLVEFVTAEEARLHYGEAQVHRTKSARAPFLLRGPTPDDSLTLGDPGKTLYRASETKRLARVEAKPVWLKSYESSSNVDATGSLIVNIDGRNEPLTVGEHHVSVEIRDQIARTTIEETFVNHTGRRLEGQFHFPLPQDASISGFGMWIGNQLVEADIVEKQRAREIYETILREKRDPGLLEWTGGNIFKARVFPIEPHSEKRIKIVYTQVLPLRGNRFRYSYGLQSELLSLHPLRELTIKILVNSAVPLKSVESTTHSCRAQVTEHAATLEFTRQEYTPTSDFEVVCEVGHRENDVLVIPHQRGDDGYFLLQLMPPGTEGDWQRELIPDGEPLELILLCDTSGSIDRTSRESQGQFVTALLSMLGPDDRFQLAVCDVDTTWSIDRFSKVDAAAIDRVREFLRQRPSLGWTDLDRAFRDAYAHATSRTHVIYIGDGITATTQSDSAAFVNRLPRLASGEHTPTLHAVSIGSSYESLALQGIAAQGGGSWRQISGETTPQIVAVELLRELTQPGLKDVHINFQGVQVAAVYPGRLPNIAAGTQQILVGRYLPAGREQKGQVVVTGTLNGQPVKYIANIQFADAESGNSFIPRLWARGHLDHLLQQGATPRTQEEIVALSEEFHIITPYTSLLVLETDADRERFGVKRRFQMRDGEKFFAEGRNNANYELRQQQMQRAGDWRLGLRREILDELAGLGRNAEVFSEWNVSRWEQHQESAARFELPVSTPFSGTGGMDMEGGGWGGGFGGMGGGFGGGSFGGYGFGLGDEPEYLRFTADGVSDELSLNFAGESWFAVPPINGPGLGGMIRNVRLDLVDGLSAESLAKRRIPTTYDFTGRPALRQLTDAQSLFALDVAYDRFSPFGKAMSHGLSDFRRSSQPDRPSPIAWVGTLFPTLPAVPSAKPAAPRKNVWTPEATEIAESLLRTESLNALKGGLRIERLVQSYDTGHDRLIPTSRRIELWSPDRWAALDAGQGRQRIVHWLDSKQRGVFSVDFQLGQRRQSDTGELSEFPLQLSDASLKSLRDTYPDYSPTIERPAADRLVLTLQHPTMASYKLRFTIDVPRQVILRQEVVESDRVSNTLTHSNFVQIANRWWATRVEIVNHLEGNVTSSLTTQTIQQLDAPDFNREYRQQRSTEAPILYVDHPLPKLNAARQAARAGTGTLNDHLILLLDFASRQQWAPMFEQLRLLEKHAPNRPGLSWIRAAVELSAGRHEQARQHLVQQAQSLVGPEAQAPQDGLVFLATYILDAMQPVLDSHEYGTIVERLKPVYQNVPDPQVALLDWSSRWLSVLDGTGLASEALSLQHQLAIEHAGNAYQQSNYTRRLEGAHRTDDALQWLRDQLAKPEHWRPWERDHLRDTYANILENRGRYDEVLPFLKSWVTEDPTTYDPYSRLLAALVFSGHVEDCDQLVLNWLARLEQPGELSDSDSQKTQAAINFCFGNARRMYNYRGMDPRWLPQLLKAARLCIQRDDRQAPAHWIIDHSDFSNSDTGDLLRGEMRTLLLNGNDNISVDRLGNLVGWLGAGRLLDRQGNKLRIRDVEESEWQILSERILQRRAEEPAAKPRRELADVLLSLYEQHLPQRYLPYLRQQVEEASEEEVGALKQQLFNALLTQPWTVDIEAEAFALWPELTSAEVTFARLAELLPSLYRLVDAMLERRIAAAQQARQDEGDVADATRKERAKSAEKDETLARSEVADRLRTLAENKAMKDAGLSDWLAAEAHYLDLLLDQRRNEVLKWCWKQLGDAPPRFSPESDDEPTPEQLSQRWLQLTLQQRAWPMVLSLAARRNASPQLITRIGNYIDAGIAQAAEDDSTQTPGVAARWKQAKYKFLLLLDQPEQLAAELQQWIARDTDNLPWRRALGLLKAELGDLPAAILLLEGVAAEEELSVREYSSLSDWYLVEDNRERYEHYRLAAYRAMGESRLSNMLYHRNNALTNGPGPHELDDDTLFVLRALFRLAASPANYYWIAANLHRATHDFRTLEAASEALLGRTQQETYHALEQFRSNLLDDVDSEAATDSMLQYIREQRARLLAGQVPRGADPETRSQSLDLRALDLLEATIERRASNVLNEPGPHGKLALAALQRAFAHPWQSGEPLQYAQFLKNMGPATNERDAASLQPLAIEQLSQLKQLFERAPIGSSERVRIGMTLAMLRYHGYGEHDAALILAESMLQEYAAAHNRLVPFSESDLVTQYSDLLQGVDSYQQAENFVERHLAALTTTDERWVYIEHLNNLHEGALQNSATTSLGTGTALFHALVKRLADQCRTQDDDQRYQLLSQLLRVHHTAFHDLQDEIPTAREDLIRFANTRLPELISKQISNYAYLIDEWRDELESASPLIAFSFLLDRFENYPARFWYSHEHPWEQHGHRLAELRRRCRMEIAPEDLPKLVSLEARLLPLVLKRLDKDLRTDEWTDRTICYRHSGHFWDEQADAFFQTALSVLQQHPDSPRIATRVAAYLYEGLEKPAAAIAALQSCHERELLDAGGVRQLVEYLLEQEHYREVIAIVRPYVELDPNDMGWRVSLGNAYFHVQQFAKLDALIAATSEHFHQHGRWNVENIEPLARLCLDTHRFQQAAALFEEVIQLERQNGPGMQRSVIQLSQHYDGLARAYTGLDATSKAVDAAAAAVVLWPATHHGRQQSLQRLEEVLRQAPDLEQYIGTLDKQAVSTGQDSPLIRKSLGQVLQQQGKLPAAVQQYRAALELQPADREVHKALLACLDQLDEQAAAVSQLMAAIDLDRHNLELYIDLARRTHENPLLAERAATSIVESAPNEAESHQALAKWRQEQNRWDEATLHWQRVAELRALEPTGLLGLAAAQIHLQQWKLAAATIQKLHQSTWPEHFGDVAGQIRQLEQQLP